MSSKLVPPHGGILKPLSITGERLAEARKKAGMLPVVKLNSRETSDLIMLAMGAFSPLDGFMKEEDYRGVVNNMQLTDGTMWPIPITLSVPSDQAESIGVNTEIALVDDESDELMGSMVVEEKYTYDKKLEAKHVFGTEDDKHPGVGKIFDQHEIYLGGPVKVFSEGAYPEIYGGYYARPAETRAIFEEKGWVRIAGFQTRNPIHRSHEYVTKIAMEVSDGILIHPLVGKLKAGDIPADIRMKCYTTLIDKYYVKENVILKVYPMEMRYGGPREALLHAIFRQNFGCSHLIIGRDHAGVGSYYGPFDAQKIFDEIPEGSLHIRPLNIDWTFWCHKCGEMASMKTCPHEKEDRVLISGTKVREMLSNGEMPPEEFTRPEISKILMEYYQNL
jgi:sulfate adenylyltransferase